MKKIFSAFFIFLVFQGHQARADLSFDPRLDHVVGAKILSSRLLTNARLSSEAGPFHLYLDGFAEFESQKSQAELRNIHQGNTYLQEAYLEFNLASFFIKAGRQSYRWSEMWTLPSLDIWTGRRFNRLFYDPLPEQLSHPLGVTASFVQNTWSLDGAIISEVGETSFPFPLSQNSALQQKNDFASPEGGLRYKYNSNEIGFSALLAQIDKETIFGTSANYVKDNLVTKLELGLRQNNSSAVVADRKNNLHVSVGTDIFVDNWSFTPQFTLFDYGDATQTKSYWQSLVYFNLQWNKDKHEFQTQSFHNFQAKDSFAHVSYGYHIKEFLTMSAFLQYYDGQENTLFGIYKKITDGALVGIRAQFFSGFTF